MKCKNCKKDTKNKKYCSRSCSVSFSNRTQPKRKAKELNCEDCGSLYKQYLDRACCKSCRKKRQEKLKIIYDIEHVKTITVGEIKERYKDVTAKNSLTIGASIRYYCGRIHKEIKTQHNFCQNCKYNKHIELCHIEPIRDFMSNRDYVTIGEINSINNILLLCPNCHWEFDNGILKLENIPKR